MIQPETRSIFRSLFIALVVGLGVNFLAAVFLDYRKILGILKIVDVSLVLVPFLCYFLIYVVDSLRLKLVLMQFGDRVSFRDGFLNSVLTIFFSNLTPFATGGQPFQIYHLTRIGVESKKAINVVLSRHVEFMMTSFLIFLFGLPVALRIAMSLRAGRALLFAGFGVSLLLGIVFLLALVRPDRFAKILVMTGRTFLGGLIGRMSNRHDWADKIHVWAETLRHEVSFLWSEKLHIMIMDVLLGLLNMVLQSSSLAFVLYRLAPFQTSIPDVMLSFVILNLVVYYVPTPGASGSIEGSYILVFSGMIGNPEMTAAAVLVWRTATYYFHILFGFIILFICPINVRDAVKAGSREGSSSWNP